MKLHYLPVVKRIAALFALAGVLGAGVYVFHGYLVYQLPPDIADRQAKERKVSLNASLAPGEELVLPGDVQPARSAAAPGAETATLVITAKGSVDGDGAVAVITASLGQCPAGAPHLENGFQTGSVLKDQPSLGGGLTRTMCATVRAGSVFDVKKLTGTWTAASVDELPELESSVQRLDYAAVDGTLLSVTVAAAGYCASEDGGCTSSISIVAGKGRKPTATLAIEEHGDVLLEFTGDAD